MRGNSRAKKEPEERKQLPYRCGRTDPVKSAAYQAADPGAIRRVGVAYWGELAEFAYWCYDLLNPLVFGGRVRHPLFQFCQVMPYGSCIGMSHTGDLDRPVIDVFLSLWTRRRSRYVAVFGVIAHELLHFDSNTRWKAAGQGYYRTSHNNEFWISGVESASPILGVDTSRLKHPFEHWPQLGWADHQAEVLEDSLARRKSPW
jgi:hypothetical protein